LSGLKIAAVYASVFLGAGFASGRELIEYFVSYGWIGLWGLIIAGVLFSLVGWAVLRICKRESINDYSGFMRFLLGEKLGIFTEFLVIAFLFCLFVAMIAGGGATANEAFNIPFSFGAIIVGVVVFFILCFGLNGIVKVNVILAPFMLLGGIFVGLFSFFSHTTYAFALIQGGASSIAWILAAKVYASYNLVTGIPVLTATAPLAINKFDAVIGGVLGGGVITILGISMSLPLFLHYTNVVALEIPFLYIVIQHGSFFNGLYLTILISALLTTAACNAFAVLEWLKARNRIKAAAILCILGVIASHVGFSVIVAYVYPVFGLVGLFKIIVILWAGFGKAGHVSKDYSDTRG